MDERLLEIKKTFKNGGIRLSDEAADRLLSYYVRLVEKNRVMNLTSITEFPDVVVKHFLDSGVLFVKLKESGVTDVFSASNLIDVGTGAGFPGMVLKILYPELQLSLLDSLDKRIVFLRETSSALGLSDVSFYHLRSEDGAKAGSILRESFSFATARAVSEMRVLAEYCLPFVKVGGIFAAYKSDSVEKELSDAAYAIETLGGKVEKVIRYTLPGTDIGRSIVVIRKEKETPLRFPRKAGKAEKSPLSAP